MSVEPHQQTPLAPKPYFDDSSERYRFCCCHVRIWATVIGILGIIFGVVGVIGSILEYTKIGETQPTSRVGSPGVLVGGIISNGLSVVACILLLIGVKKEKRFLLIPYLVLGVITIIFVIIIAVLCFIGSVAVAASETRKNADEGESSTAVLVAMGAGYLIAAALEALFLYPVFRCYKYLAMKQLAYDASAHVPMSTTYSAVEKGI